MRKGSVRQPPGQLIIPMNLYRKNVIFQESENFQNDIKRVRKGSNHNRLLKEKVNLSKSIRKGSNAFDVSNAGTRGSNQSNDNYLLQNSPNMSNNVRQRHGSMNKILPSSPFK